MSESSNNEELNQLNEERDQINHLVQHEILNEEGEYVPVVDPTPDEEYVLRDRDDNLGAGLGIVSFLFPIVGGIVWLNNRKSKPNKASSACWCAIIGMLLTLVFNIAAG
jgi:hypothetical protein